MKLLILLGSLALAAATPAGINLVDRADDATTVTKTASTCPPYASATAPATTYVPHAPPAKCNSIYVHNITYQLYTEKCYYEVDSSNIDRGETFDDIPRSQPCVAVARCGQYASDPTLNGYEGGGSTYSFAVYWDPGTQPNDTPSWICYAYLGADSKTKPGTKPPPFSSKNQYYIAEGFGYYQVKT